MKVAFFDFDGTLVRHDSFRRFAVFCVGKRAFNKACLISIPGIVLWKMGVKSNSEAKQRLFSLLFKGMDYVRFKAFGMAFAAMLNCDEHPEGMRILKNHKNHGDRVIIVSASIVDWIRPWAKTAGVDEVLATEVEIDDRGKLTGRFRTPNCYGREKMTRIRQLIPDVDEYETWAYGDGPGDKAMFTLVNHPMVVR